MKPDATETFEPVRITAYPLADVVPELRAAHLERDWMDATNHRFAYRCLPLNIANQLGWQIVSDTAFSVTWTGALTKEALTITIDGEAGFTAPVSHFGSGIFTFHTGYIFRTSPGVSLLVTGPLNMPLHGVYALSGVVETAWSPFPFTMNWRVTAPCTDPVYFPKGHPICQIIPVGLEAMEEVVCDVQLLESNPDLKDQYEAWQHSRHDFLMAERKPHEWQKHYFTGKRPDGASAETPHRTKLRLPQFPGVTLDP